MLMRSPFGNQMGVPLRFFHTQQHNASSSIFVIAEPDRPCRDFRTITRPKPRAPAALAASLEPAAPVAASAQNSREESHTPPECQTAWSRLTLQPTLPNSTYPPFDSRLTLLFAASNPARCASNP